MSAPRLVTRALVSSFVTLAIVLGAVFAVLSLRVRDQPADPLVYQWAERARSA